MKSISVQGNDGKDRILLLGNLNKKDVLGADHLKRLQPYVSSIIHARPDLRSAKDKLTVVDLSDHQAAFAFEGVGKELLNKIRDVCKEELTENLIVTQNVKNGPSIRHRVMQFEVEDSRLVVKYHELGEFNNFDAAMIEIAEMHPEVSAQTVKGQTPVELQPKQPAVTG